GFEYYYLWQRCHTQLRALRGDTLPISSLAYGPEGKVLVCASNEPPPSMWGITGTDSVPSRQRGNVTLWAPDTGKKRWTITDLSGGVTALAFAPDGKTVAVGSSTLAGGMPGPADYRGLVATLAQGGGQKVG